MKNIVRNILIKIIFLNFFIILDKKKKKKPEGLSVSVANIKTKYNMKDQIENEIKQMKKENEEYNFLDDLNRTRASNKRGQDASK